MQAVGGIITVGTGDFENSIGDEVLTGAVAFHDGLNQVLGDISIVRKELLRVLREAVAAVAEGRVVIVRADAGIEADAVDDVLRGETLRFRVGVEFIEEGDTEREIGVREEFHGLGFGETGEEGRDAGLDGTFLKERGEGVGGFCDARIILVCTDDNTARVQVIVERL